MHDGAVAENKGLSEALYFPDFPVDGLYRVFEWHPGRNPACSHYLGDASVEVYQATTSTEATYDQSQNGGQWNELGTFRFSAGRDERQYIRLRSLPAPGQMTFFVADALRFVLVEDASAAKEGFLPASAASPGSDSLGSWDSDLELLRGDCSAERAQYCDGTDGLELCNCLCRYSRLGYSHECLGTLQMFMRVHHNAEQPLAMGHRSFLVWGFVVVAITGVLIGLIVLAGRRSHMAAAATSEFAPPTAPADIAVFQASPMRAQTEASVSARAARPGFVVAMNPGESRPQIAVPVKSSTVAVV